MFIPRYQKTYLSRAMTRAMSIDHPIGDPHGGPAYGERNEPVSAILAIGGMAFTAEAAIGGSIMAGLAFAGSALSLVGNITGNSTLSKIGLVAGLVGGAGMSGLFGQAAQGATWGSTFGGSAGAAGAAPTAELAQTPTAAASGAQASPVDVQSGITSTRSIVPDASSVNTSVNAQTLANSGPSLASQPTVGAAASSAAPAPDLSGSAVGSAAPGAQAPVGAPSAPSAAGVAAPSAPTTGFQSIPNTAQPGQAGYGWQYYSDAAGGPGAAIDPEGRYFLGTEQRTGVNGGPMGFGDYANQAWQGIKSAGSSAMELAKTNPGAAYVMGMGAMSVGDYLSGKTQAQINQMEAAGQLSKAQADKIRYEMDLAEKRRNQLNANQAVPLNLQINPNGVQFAPGLIAGARTGG